MSSTPGRRARTALSTAIYVAGGVAVGLIVGGLAGRLWSASGMGWDQLADVLGGVSIGMMTGGVVTLGTARRIPPARRLRIGSAMLLASAIVFVVLRARMP